MIYGEEYRRDGPFAGTECQVVLHFTTQNEGCSSYHINYLLQGCFPQSWGNRLVGFAGQFGNIQMKL
jgi:hypothetical protein